MIDDTWKGKAARARQRLRVLRARARFESTTGRELETQLVDLSMILCRPILPQIARKVRHASACHCCGAPWSDARQSQAAGAACFYCGSVHP